MTGARSGQGLLKILTSRMVGGARQGWSATGSRTVNVEPRPGPGLVTVMSPPCASTRALAMLNPIPEPPRLRSRAVSTR